MPNYSSTSTSQRKRRRTLLVQNSLKQIITSEAASVKNAVVASNNTSQDVPNTISLDLPNPDNDNRPSHLSTSNDNESIDSQESFLPDPPSSDDEWSNKDDMFPPDEDNPMQVDEDLLSDFMTSAPLPDNQQGTMDGMVLGKYYQCRLR
jgi:hypothetical protein